MWIWAALRSCSAKAETRPSTDTGQHCRIAVAAVNPLAKGIGLRSLAAQSLARSWFKSIWRHMLITSAVLLTWNFW